MPMMLSRGSLSCQRYMQWAGLSYKLAGRDHAHSFCFATNEGKRLACIGFALLAAVFVNTAFNTPSRIHIVEFTSVHARRNAMVLLSTLASSRQDHLVFVTYQV